MILAGDVGGTKTDLSLFERVDGRLVERRTHRFDSKSYPDLVSLLREFLGADGVAGIESAGFGVPGPVVDGRCEATNLTWVVDVRHLAAALGERHVTLVNDLVATAAGVLDLPADHLVTLLEGKPHESATRAVIAPGTGLGESILYWDGGGYHAVPSEAGHADFAARNAEELALTSYLLGRFPRVSVERVLAGPGITHLYEFLRDTQRVDVPADVDAEIRAASDSNAAITQLALEKRAAVCVHALDLWISILGAEAGNLALRAVAEGGVYLAGGIVGRLVDPIRSGPFAPAFLAKTPLDDFIRGVPVRLVTEPRTALFGAARLAAGS
ncbi:MAG TPA: glucokinase [Candidatus Eisenbacteria bacterium]|nr:glucokinase [Candidatus Eisenbacteria bacterium]